MTTFCHTTCDLEDGAVRQLLTPSQLETLATVVYRSLYGTVHDLVWYVISAWGGDGNRSYLEGGWVLMVTTQSNWPSSSKF